MSDYVICPHCGNGALPAPPTDQKEVESTYSDREGNIRRCGDGGADDPGATPMGRGAAEITRLRARIKELEAETKRLGKTGAERYWEARWRDEAKRADELEALLRECLPFVNDAGNDEDAEAQRHANDLLDRARAILNAGAEQRAAVLKNIK